MQDFTPADPDDVVRTLAFALGRNKGLIPARPRARQLGDEGAWERILAAALLRQLELSNFRIVQGPPRAPHSTP